MPSVGSSIFTSGRDLSTSVIGAVTGENACLDSDPSPRRRFLAESVVFCAGGGVVAGVGSAGLAFGSTVGRTILVGFSVAGSLAAGGDFFAVRVDFRAGRAFVGRAAGAFRRTDFFFGADALARGLAVMGGNRPLVLPGPSLVGG